MPVIPPLIADIVQHYSRGGGGLGDNKGASCCGPPAHSPLRVWMQQPYFFRYPLHVVVFPSTSDQMEPRPRSSVAYFRPVLHRNL